MDLALIGSLGMPELLIIMVIALLLFGRRLPEVARSLGKGIVEFKRGMSGIEEDLDPSVNQSAQKASAIEGSSSKSTEVETSQATGSKTNVEQS